MASELGLRRQLEVAEQKLAIALAEIERLTFEAGLQVLRADNTEAELAKIDAALAYLLEFDGAIATEWGENLMPGMTPRQAFLEALDEARRKRYGR
jgi:hypothetical protein